MECKILKKISNVDLIKLLINTSENAYYHHDSTEQEKAKKELPMIEVEVLKRMN